MKLRIPSVLVACVCYVIAALPELVTNLDDNMICYLHMYGLRTGTREIGDGYMFGFFDEKTNTVVPLVKTIKNTEQVIGQKQDFQALTSNNTHAPKYDPEVDYCAQVEKLLEIEKSNGSIEPNTPYILKRDSSSCYNQKCVNENQCAPHGKRCSECYNDEHGTFCIWDAARSQRGGTCYYCLGIFRLLLSHCHIAKGLRQCA